MQDRDISDHHDPDSSVIVNGVSPTTNHTNLSESVATSPQLFDIASKHGIEDLPSSSSNILQTTACVPSNVCRCKACDAERVRTCSCVACQFAPLHDNSYARTCCRYVDCQDRSFIKHGQNPHEQKHFGTPGKYTCPVDHCPTTGKAFKRWAELTRHSRVAHCKNPERFTCHVLGCKYRENGFARKDKLASHIRNVHTGKSTPGKGLRKLQRAAPKVGGSALRKN